MTRTLAAAAAALLGVAGVALAFPASSSASTASTASTASAASASNSPWPQTYGNAALDRANLTEHTLTASNVHTVHLLRSVRSAPSDEDCIAASSAVLSGGYIYSVLDNQLKKINAKSGHVQWSKQAGVDDATYVTDLAVVGNTVVLDEADCHSESDPNRLISAFDATSGAPKWQARAEGGGNMVVSQGYVVVIGGFSVGMDLYAFRLSNGSTAWSRTADCETEARVAVVHGLVVYGWCTETSNSVEADRITTGAKVWTRAGATGVAAGDLDSTSGRNVIIYDQGNVVRDLDPATGHNRFALSGVIDVLAVAPRHVLADCSTDAVCSYSLQTGAREWRRSDIGPGNSAAEANGVLYLSNGLALRTSTGQTLAHLLPNSSVASAGAPAVGDGRLVVPLYPANGDPSYLGVYGLSGN